MEINNATYIKRKACICEIQPVKYVLIHQLAELVMKKFVKLNAIFL